MKPANDNGRRYVTGAGNLDWVEPAFVEMTKAEIAILSEPLVEFQGMVSEAIAVVISEKSPLAQCCVYVISDIYGREVKVGKATNPAYRLSQLQTGNPKKLFIHRVFWMSQSAADEVEREAHRLVEGKFGRLEGEWFSCSPSVAHKEIELAIECSRYPIRYCAMTPIKDLWRAA